CHPSCDSPCGLSRKLGPGRRRVEVRERPSLPLAAQGQRSGTAKQCKDVYRSCCFLHVGISFRSIAIGGAHGSPYGESSSFMESASYELPNCRGDRTVSI